MTDYLLELAKGNVAGHAHVNKFGANPNSGVSLPEDVWDEGGVYPFPAAAEITHLSQAADQVGMRSQTIEVQGLNNNWDLIIQAKDLDASDTTTPVALDAALRRVFRMKVLADIIASQNINLKNSTGTTIYATMIAGNNQTLMAIYTIACGKTGYITNYYCNVLQSAGLTPKSTDFQLWTADRASSYEFQLKHSKGIPEDGVGFQHFFQPYIKVTQKSDIKISALPVTQAGRVHAGFDLILVDN